MADSDSEDVVGGGGQGDGDWNLDDYRLPPEYLKMKDGQDGWHHAGPERPRYEQFIRGPVDMAWMQKAFELRDVTVLWVALHLWRIRTMNKQATFRVSNVEAGRWGITRQQKYRAFRKLAEAGLIETGSLPGQARWVRVVDLPGTVFEQPLKRERKIR